MVNNQILPYGELTIGDENLLRNYGNMCRINWKDPVAVELGTFFGRGAAILSEYFSAVYTIDCFEDLHLINNIGSAFHYKEHLLTFPRNYDIVRWSLERFTNIQVMRGNTSDVAEEFLYKDPTFLFIDADHTFEGVKADYDAWYPKVVPGGYIMIHDSGLHAKWLEPGLFCKTITNATRIDDSDCSTVWRKPE
jgi:cephalosporin hydroxylase